MTDSPPGQPPERRQWNDRRRRHPLLADWRVAFRGRRRASRRAGDSERAVLDRHRPSVVAASIGVLLLSVADAALTLELIRHAHASEANPFLRTLLGGSPRLFVGIKMLVTSVGVVGLVLYANHLVAQRIPLSRVLYWLLAIYAVLVGYEVCMVLARAA